ncbi:MAG: hypothetical protein ACFB6R_17175 [Alphaproteobacteria bacterium]
MPESKSPAQFQSTAPNTEELPSIVIYGHSPLLYWWPVWLLGFVCAGMSYMLGEPVRIEGYGPEFFHPSAILGTCFTTLTLVVIVFTTSAMRGLYSLIAVLALALFLSLAGWAGLLDDLAGLVPGLSIHMNMGFYLFFSGTLFVLWCLAFFVFDRFVYWRIRPGQMTEERLVGDAEQSYDTRGILFEKYSEDYFRNLVLGLGTGDIRLNTSGAKRDIIVIPNVLFADAKVRKIQQLIAVEPDELLDQD